MKYSDRDHFVASLREFADFIEKNGHKLPMDQWDTQINITAFLYDDDDKGSAVSQMKNAVKVLGKAEKNHGAYHFDVKRKFGTITLEFSVPREKICERVVVGKKEIPEQILPARTEEIVEWRCNDSLLAAADLA